jgi:hypothetical protein
MARLYAATGDGIARLEESGEAWTVELSLPGTDVQCLAVDPDDPDTVYAGLREGGVRRTVDGGRSWVACALPEPGVFSLAVSAPDGAVYAGTEPGRLFRSDDRGHSWRTRSVARAPLASGSELPAAATLGTPSPVGTAIAITPGHAAVGHASEPDDVVVFALDAESPRVAYERAATAAGDRP